MAWINPRQIEAFRAVMITGTATDAAAHMGVTQPAISRLLRDLQRALELRLFERHGTRLTPTNEALTLYAEVERSFIGLARIANVAHELKERRAGLVRIAAMPALINGFLPRFVGGLLASRPKLDLTLDGLLSHLVLEQAISGQCDLGFAIGPFEHSAVIVHQMPTARMVAVLPSGHPLAEKPVIHVSDLHGRDFVALTHSSRSRRRVDELCQQHNARPIIRAETQLSEITCALVASGLGIAVCDPFTGGEFNGRGVVVRRFEPVVDFEFAAIRSAQRQLPAVARELLDAFTRHVAAFVAGRSG
jgi:DNA-binding transcriptional LysR family regulator